MRRKNSIQRENVAFIDFVELDEEEREPESSKVHVVELKLGPPYVCTSLKPVKGKEKANGSTCYSFNITKAEQIFDVLLKDKQIVIPDGKKLPSLNELKGQKFCKFYQIRGHITNICVRFRDLIQKAVKEGRLKFEEKEVTMKVDTNPFKFSSSLAKPIFISANIAGVEADYVANVVRMKWANELELDHFEGVKKLLAPKN